MVIQSDSWTFGYYCKPYTKPIIRKETSSLSTSKLESWNLSKMTFNHDSPITNVRPNRKKYSTGNELQTSDETIDPSI